MPDKSETGGWRCVIALPPRGDTQAQVEEEWQLDFPDGVDFEGQHFSLPGGCAVKAAAQWLEPEVLSVKLSLQGEATVPCARCLSEAALAISDDLLYLYYSHEPDFEFDDMPVEVDFFGRTLDLTPQVWESLLLLLPARVLCRPDCKGLCPHCGADLNEGPCSCEGGEVDPRFEVLKKFKEKEVKEEE